MRPAGRGAAGGARPPWTRYPAYILFRLACWAVRLLPLRLAYRLAEGGSRIACLVDLRHTAVARRNLDIAFGGSKTKRQKRAIVRGAYRNLFLTMTEFILTPKISRSGEPFSRPVNIRVVRRALRAGKGILFAVSHFGNWETMATRTPEFDGIIKTVDRPLRNTLIHGEIERLRAMNNLVGIGKKRVVREIIDQLRRNRGVTVMTDQYAGRHAPFVPFFGRPASTPATIPILALKTGAAVIPAFDVRVGYGRHEVHLCEPVPMASTGDRDADIAEGCARINRVVEEWVRRHPDHWMWMARRWRRKKAPCEA